MNIVFYDLKSIIYIIDTCSGKNKVSKERKVNLLKIFDGDTLLQMADQGQLTGTIELEEREYVLDRTLILREPVVIEGNGASFSGKASNAMLIHSGEVVLKNFTLNNFPNSISVDAKGKTISNIVISHVNANDPGFGMVFNIGSTENDSLIRDIHFEDCVIRSAYKEDSFLEKGMFDGATAFMIAAASPTSDRLEDVCRCGIDGLYIERCEAYGGRRYGINALAGIILPQEGYDFYDQKAKVVDCYIRNVKVLDCVFNYCREMGISFSCGTLMNYGSYFENLEVARCTVYYGISAIGYSAAGPVVPTSVARNMGVRHGTIHDNHVIEMDLPVNEPNLALGLTGGRAEGIKGVECYDCYVEDIQFYNNTVENAMVGFAIGAANTMTDEKCWLARNYIRDVEVYNNTFLNCQKVFFITAAYGEGRRLDYDWGWCHRDHQWAPLLEDNREQTVEFTGNYVENVNIHDNYAKGCRYEIEATGVTSRGHAVAKDNKLINIRYHGNKFDRSEGHVIVTPVRADDWVTDAGGNESAMHILYEK